MDRHFLPLTGLLAIVFAGMLAAGCSKPSYLDVRYALPPSSHALSGMQAALDLAETGFKVFLVDTSRLSEIYRILAFFALAVILGLAWLAYQRIRIDGNTQEIEESDAHASNDT